MTAHEFLPYYQGRAQSVVVRTTTGQKVEFPAMHLRAYLTSAGVRGHFCLQTSNNKFLSIEKIS